jgi:hypothetical protein
MKRERIINNGKNHPFVMIISLVLTSKEDINNDDVNLEDDNWKTYTETVVIKSRPSAFAFLINPCSGGVLSCNLS